MSDVLKFEVEVKKGDSQSSSTVTKETFVVGRAPTCDVIIDHPQVSREHLRVEWKDEKIFITDLGSSHGTSLNGKPLTPKKSSQYISGDNLTFANKVVSITINQLSKSQTQSLQIELSTPDFSVPQVPVPSSIDLGPKITGTHFLGATSKVSPLGAAQVDSAEQIKKLIQKRENEEQALQNLAENQKARHLQLEQIVSQLSTLD